MAMHSVVLPLTGEQVFFDPADLIDDSDDFDPDFAEATRGAPPVEQVIVLPSAVAAQFGCGWLPRSTIEAIIKASIGSGGMNVSTTLADELLGILDAADGDPDAEPLDDDAEYSGDEGDGAWLERLNQAADPLPRRADVFPIGSSEDGELDASDDMHPAGTYGVDQSDGPLVFPGRHCAGYQENAWRG